MCAKTESSAVALSSQVHSAKNMDGKSSDPKKLAEPSLAARYTCASVLMGVFAVWGKLTFVGESEMKVGQELHSYKIPLGLTVFYLISLPLLRELVSRYVNVDMKLLLKESMILYNGGQVLLNAWMVYRCVDAVLFGGHPFVGALEAANSGATYAVWVHYCDKYLEFLDTYFMVLRGNYHQVSFLHVYHHFTIAWAWWLGIWFWPEGDCYFGAMLNSLIHVMMYSYYTMSLLRINCPFKKYLTMAQLAQFTTVVIYSLVSLAIIPSGTHWTRYAALFCQMFEMISLFVLFLHFYRKSYNKGGKAAKPTEKKDAAKVSEDMDEKAPGSPLRTSETSDTSDSEEDEK